MYVYIHIYLGLTRPTRRQADRGEKKQIQQTYVTSHPICICIYTKEMIYEIYVVNLPNAAKRGPSRRQADRGEN